MLAHHGKEPYQEAASKAADQARIELQEQIDKGRIMAQHTVKRVMDEVPEDRIIKARALDFFPNEHGDMRIKIGDTENQINSLALQQLCSRADIPVAMYRKLIGNQETEIWGPKLMSHIFKEVYSNMEPSKKFLARSYKGRLRGWLSDSYRRLDSRPLLDSFLGACQKLQLIPLTGYATETKVMMKCVFPKVFEPAENEVVAFGATWENSDYGNGKLNMRVFVLRLWCTNFAIGEEGFHQIHLGKKLAENISFSQATYDLDTQTSASAITDIVHGSLSPDRVQAMCAAIEEAASDTITDPKAYLQRLKNSLAKGELDQIADKYITPDVQLLPPGNTTWRMSNAISLFANEVDDTERKIELMKLAGSVIPKLAA